MNKLNRMAATMGLAFITVFVLGPITARTQTALDGFDPNADNSVRTIAVQPDGKILLGGLFHNLGAVARSHIGRVNADGSLDTTFNPGAESDVQILAVQPDGGIVVAGDFATLGGSACVRIGRLNSDGALDAGFDAGAGADAYVRTMALQADGQVLVGGDFQNLGGQPRQYIGRLSTNGTLDASFNPGADGHIRAIAVQADGKILVGGEFTNAAGTAWNHLARLNTDGSPDTTFNTAGGADGAVLAIAMQADGKILVGGEFTNFAGIAHSRIARLNADGGLDTTFNPVEGANNIVRTIAFQPDGKILVGGDFTSFEVARNRIVRLNRDGSLDTVFNPSAGADGIVYALAVQQDSKLLIGGDFANLAGTAINCVGRLYASSGNLDVTFNPLNVDNPANTMLAQPDGKIVLGGDFTSIAGIAREYIARFNPGNGVLDDSFDPGADSSVYALAMQADGKILVGGAFIHLGGVAVNYLGRVQANGSIDISFIPGLDGTVACIAVQNDGKILVAGSFHTVGTATRMHIARLNADGTVDTDFDPNVNDVVYSMDVQADGKIIIGGHFSTVEGTSRTRIARLNADGTIDTSFDPGAGADADVYVVAVLNDGKILAAGAFNNLRGQARNFIGRLNTDGTLDTGYDPNASDVIFSATAQADGKVIVGGNFTTIGAVARVRIARLNTDGSVDTDFNLAGGAINLVNALTLQSDAKLLVGGTFHTLGGQARGHIGRITMPEAALQSLNANGSDNSISWIQGGSSPKLEQVIFQQSSNGSTWTNLGLGASLTNGWQITGVSLPLNQNVYIRALGFARGGIYNGSGSLIESVRLAYLTTAVYQVSADYDGDRLADPCVYDEATGNWRVRFSTTEYQLVEVPALLGGPGWRPVAADFDGDRKADPAACQTATGTWQAKLSANDYGLAIFTNLLGGPGWLPVANDYDNDRLADPGVYEQATGTWQFKLSGGDYALLTYTNWLGGTGYTPALGDNDGDGLGDPVVYQEATGNWQTRFSTQSYSNVFQADAFVGGPGYNAAAADYDGDGMMDPGVFQPSTGDWKVRLSINNYDEVDLPGFLQ